MRGVRTVKLFGLAAMAAPAMVALALAGPTSASVATAPYAATAPSAASAPAGPETPAGLITQTGVMPTPPSRAPWEWEPQLAIDGRGVLWAVGGHCPFIDQYGPCGAPTEGPGRADILAVWRSDDGGRTWRFVADPLAAPGALANTSDTPGSSDPDIAVTPVARPGKPPILATVSLFGVSSTLAVSPDDGRSWAVIPAVGIPGQDRPWLAASGMCDLYLEYDPIADLAGAATVPRVERYDACAIAAAAPGTAAAVPAVSQIIEPATNAVTQGNQLPGRLAAGRDGLFASYLSCDAASTCTLGVARSADRAATWVDLAPPAPALTIASDPTFPISASADTFGNVAIAVTDRRHVYVWVSPDGGKTWPVARRPVDLALGWSLANVPSVAVRDNEIVAAWFGSPPSSGSQAWYLVVARSSDGGATWQDAVVGPVLATTPHATALGPGLYDDFGSAITPAAGDVMVYTQSCQGHPVSDPGCPGPAPGVTGTYDVTRYALVAPTTAAAGKTTPSPPSRGPTTPAPAEPSPGNLPATGGTNGSLTWSALALLIAGILIQRRRGGRNRRVAP